MNKKIAFLVPVYPPHFDYARNLLQAHEKYELNLQSDLWFIFTDEKEKAEFGEYEHSIVLPEDLRVFEHNGIINIKKFYGLRQIQKRYEYIIVLDAESLFVKKVDLYSVCNEYFDNEILPEGIPRVENIKTSCKKYFAGHKDFEKLNNPLYLWFNQPCIYKTATLDDFWEKIAYEQNITKLQWADFDYYIYMFYLILFQGFHIEDIEIKSNYGICEADFIFLQFKSQKYKTTPILMCSKAAVDIFDNEKLFIVIHLDRDMTWFLRVLQARINDLYGRIECHEDYLNNLNKTLAQQHNYNASVDTRLNRLETALAQQQEWRQKITNNKLYRLLRFIRRLGKND